MGDVVISTALIQDIVNAFPNAQIDINTLPPWDLLFKNDPRFSRIIAIDLHGKGKRFSGTLGLLRIIKKGCYDMIVDLQSNDRSQILLILFHLFFRRTPYRVGNHQRYPYNIFPKISPSTILPAFEHQRLTIDAMGIATLNPRPVLYVNTVNRKQAETLLHKNSLQSGHFVIFLPGCDAHGRLKRWGITNYARLAFHLHRKKGFYVVLIGASDEQEECHAIQKLVDQPWLINLCGQTAVQEIVPICKQSAAIVANDTGTAHIAACAPTPMVVICGPTNPHRVKPPGPNVIAIQAKLDCINCYCKKSCNHQSCMKRLSPEIVLQHLEKIMTHPEGIPPSENDFMIIC